MALWVFLGVASSLFVLFVSAYAMRLGLADWTPLPRPRLLMVNTAVLVAASLAMQWTVHVARRGDPAGLRRGLAAGGVLTIAFLAGQLVVWQQLMAVIVGWLFRQTIHVQPWSAQAALAATGAPVAAPARMALWVFLGVASSLFVLFVSAYAMRLGLADWTPLPRPRLLMVNTGLLVAASLAMQWTVHAARRGDLSALRRGLAAGGLFSIAFLAGQLYVWKQMVDAGYFVSTNAATAFFYLFTAVHGLHVLGGLVAWLRASVRAWRGAGTARLRLAVELCATYWHYLLAVWVVLYALLVSNDFGLAICSLAPL
jgi:cytochrome c oxidase subunit 3